MFLDPKSFDLNFRGPKNKQGEAFSIQGHDPRMLKTMISTFWDLNISN